MPARATGIRSQFFAPDDNRADLLGRLDRHGADATWKGRGVKAVGGRPRAGATTVEHKQLFDLADELSCIVGRHTPILMHANLNIPGCPRPLGRHTGSEEATSEIQAIMRI